jgi:hypothetical protein
LITQTVVAQWFSPSQRSVTTIDYTLDGPLPSARASSRLKSRGYYHNPWN